MEVVVRAVLQAPVDAVAATGATGSALVARMRLVRQLFVTACVCMAVCEAAGCLVIIQRVAYTEIDWVAYMQEVGGFLSGETDYYKLGGDTGPLVYPAGFVYIYSALFHATNEGKDLRMAQFIFAALYLMTLVTAFAIYFRSARIPLYAVGLLCLSKRVHSLFVLRMFNDCIAALLTLLAVLLFMRQRWRIGAVLYSLGVSVKMNVLLFAPGLLLLFLQALGVRDTIVCLAICALVQLVLGAPFLLSHPISYIARSFELSRVFLHKWTVNFKFLDEETFQSKTLALALLLGTVLCLALFATKIVREARQHMKSDLGKVYKQLGVSFLGFGTLQPDYVAYVLFVSNFIGVVFARTMHYQFYVWYFHSIPFLLWHTRLPAPLRVAMLGGIELCYNIYPATPASSATLQILHLTLLLALYLCPSPSPVPDRVRQPGAISAQDFSGRQRRGPSSSSSGASSSSPSSTTTATASKSKSKSKNA